MKTEVKRVRAKGVVFLCLFVLLSLFCISVCVFAPMKSVAKAEEAFAVTGKNGVAGTIAAKSEMFSDNDTYRFDNPPANLTGVNYIKSPQAGDTYTVTSGEGYVYVLTVADNPYATSGKPEGEVSQSQNLLLDGFEQVKFTFYVNFCDAHSNNNNSNHYTFFPFEVYKKFVRKGSEFTLRNTSVVMYSQKEICFETAVPQDASNTVETLRGGD